jgi:hypothetical protein
MDEALHGGEEQALAHLGIGTRRGPFGIRHPEEVEQERQRVGELRVEEQELAGDLLARRLVGVAFGDAEVGTEVLDDGEEGDRLPVRHAMRLVDGKPARPAALGELVAEAALADPGLGHDADHLTVSTEGPRKRDLECRHVVAAPDEAGEAARAGHVQARSMRAEARELVDSQPPTGALEGEVPEVLEAKQPGDERRGVFGQVSSSLTA